MELPIIKVTAQRFPMDCSVACLAMICGVSYENALVALAQDVPNVCATGAWQKNLTKAARLLGVRLVSRKRFDLESDTGILWTTADTRPKTAHLVVLWEGRIIDTDNGLYMQDVYFSVTQSKPTMLLVAEKR